MALGLTTFIGGCGGDGGGGPAPITSSPEPSPTATPTSPPILYQSPVDYSANFTFSSSIGYAIDQFVPDSASASYPALGVYLIPNDQTTKISFVAQPEGVEFSYAGSTAIWTGADRQSYGIQRYYRHDVDDVFLGYEGGRTATHVSKVAWRRFIGAATVNGVAGRRARISVGIVGASTVVSDLPTGSFEYRGSSLYWSGPGFDFPLLHDSTARLSLRDSTIVSGSTAVNFRGTNISLLYSGQLDRTSGVLSGVLENPDKTITGTFKGRLFGPQGREVAIAFYLRRTTDRAEFVGDFIGQR